MMLYVYYIFSDYKEYHTDSTVRFVVSMGQQKMDEAASAGFHKKFKLENSLNTTNMVGMAVS